MLRHVKQYLKPESVEEAVALVQSNPKAAYLGGGAWLVAFGSDAVETVVDLQKVGIGGIEADIDKVTIGAMATLQTMIDDANVARLANGILATAAGYTQSRTLREQGTLGGTLIVADAADPITTALLVLDATITYADPVLHKAPFDSFVAYRDRLIKNRALLTAVTIARPPAHSAAAFERVGRSPKDKPIVCAAAYVAIEEGLPTVIRVAVGGADAAPVRLLKSEHLLKGRLLDKAKVEEALRVAIDELQPIADFRGSADYRREMAAVLARRAILAAWEQARRA